MNTIYILNRSSNAPDGNNLDEVLFASFSQETILSKISELQSREEHLQSLRPIFRALYQETDKGQPTRPKEGYCLTSTLEYEEYMLKLKDWAKERYKRIEALKSKFKQEYSLTDYEVHQVQFEIDHRFYCYSTELI